MFIPEVVNRVLASVERDRHFELLSVGHEYIIILNDCQVVSERAFRLVTGMHKKGLILCQLLELRLVLSIL